MSEQLQYVLCIVLLTLAVRTCDATDAMRDAVKAYQRNVEVCR